MLKSTQVLNPDLEALAVERLRAALNGVPFLSLGEITGNQRFGSYT